MNAKAGDRTTEENNKHVEKRKKEIHRINPMKLLQLKPLLGKFRANHPKFVQFFAAASQSGLTEGSVIEVSITNPDGKNLCTNLKLTQEDLEMFQTISETIKGQ